MDQTSLNPRPPVGGKDAESLELLFRTYLARLTSNWRPLASDFLGSPEATLRALWLAARGESCSFEAAMSRPLSELTEIEASRLESILARFEAGVPLAHLTQRWRFMGLDFHAGPQALIPRKETELLCSRALDLLSRLVEERGKVLVIEPCTGAGNLAVTLAHREPSCRVCAADLSETALDLARKNAAHFEVVDRIEFSTGDLFAPFDRSNPAPGADLVICNPPYISSPRLDAMPEHILRYGPRMAFDGGPFGLSIISRLISEAPRYLKPNSYLCFEAGIGQGPLLARMMGRLPEYSSVQIEFEPATQTPIILARTRASPSPPES